MFGKVGSKDAEELLTVSQAAVFMGVSSNTIRNWDRSGKLKAVRHPMNKYRLYNRKQLEAVLRKLR
ncbi:MAG: helix-turn-helix domain-containing protein [Planctomycetes bacterium]|nr:helix-turn-helix domain-containing protein [Planctomycetota bacterium]